MGQARKSGKGVQKGERESTHKKPGIRNRQEPSGNTQTLEPVIMRGFRRQENRPKISFEHDFEVFLTRRTVESGSRSCRILAAFRRQVFGSVLFFFKGVQFAVWMVLVLSSKK